MEKTMNSPLTNSLINTVQDLSNSLKPIQPANSQTTQIITYALIATAITGIFIYHYIRQQENL